MTRNFTFLFRSDDCDVESSPGFQLETSRGLDSQLETPWAHYSE